MKTKKDSILKRFKHIVLYRPINYRLSFYIVPMGDINPKQEFTLQDLDNIRLIEEGDAINNTLFDSPSVEDDSNVFALMVEGVLPGQKTGADLGIYNYGEEDKSNKVNKAIVLDSKSYVRSFDVEYEDDIPFNTTDNYSFSNCILAEESPLGGYATKIVQTFKGYLEVTLGDFGIIRRCNSDIGVEKVYIPKDYIKKYHLRNGDELMGVCVESKDKMLLSSLFTINQQSCYKWNIDRQWINDMQPVATPKSLKPKGDYTKAIVNKFGLVEGDSVFLYLNKNTQKNQVLSNIMEELSSMFDKVIYINPRFKPNTIVGGGDNIIKFCTPIARAGSEDELAITLLGVNHARRLIELGKRIAIVVDDIDAIVEVDKKYFPDTPVAKSIMLTSQAFENESGTLFAVAPLRNKLVQNYQLPNCFKNFETLGVVIDGDEIDLFNSYRL